MSDHECFMQRIVGVEDTIKHHHDRLDRHEQRIADLQESLHENTALTRQIAENTSELVELFKGAKMFRKFVLWVGPLVALAYSAYHWLTGGK